MLTQGPMICHFIFVMLTNVGEISPWGWEGLGEMSRFRRDLVEMETKQLAPIQFVNIFQGKRLHCFALSSVDILSHVLYWSLLFSLLNACKANPNIVSFYLYLLDRHLQKVAENHYAINTSNKILTSWYCPTLKSIIKIPQSSQNVFLQLFYLRQDPTMTEPVFRHLKIPLKQISSFVC